LFGHPIIPHRRLTVAQQIHKILVEEIHAGRWRIGTRLPGVVKLSTETGLGNKTLQEAFTLLKEDGYIIAEPNKGSYLTSLLPKNAQAGTSRIGILLTEEQAEIPYTLWLSHLFMDAALRHNFLGEVRIVKSDSAWDEVVRKGNTFGPEVKAILSLTPFHLSATHSPGLDSLPVLFFCHMIEDCNPLVALDTVHSYYELTRKSVQSGHTDILFIEDSDMESRFSRLHRHGYRVAMKELGLTRQEAACSRNNPKEMENLLRSSLAGGKATMVLSGSLQLVENAILPAAQKLKVKIPDQLSLLSIGSAKLPWNEDLCSSGIELDFEYIASTCFEQLNQLATTGDCHQTRTLVKGTFISGDTLLDLKSVK
jgi:DNA-binding transcriptional regulator YhcF (GntR family)